MKTTPPETLTVTVPLVPAYITAEPDTVRLPVILIVDVPAPLNNTTRPEAPVLEIVRLPLMVGRPARLAAAAPRLGHAMVRFPIF